MLTTAERHTAITPTPANWSFLTSHARVLLCIAHDPEMRLRDIAARLGITERSAHGIITELAQAGYVVKHKDGRRNRYQIQTHLPLPEPTSRERTVGDILTLLAGPDTTPRPAGEPHGSRRSPGHTPAPGEPDRRPGQHRNVARQAAAAAPPSGGRTAKGRPLPPGAASRGSGPPGRISAAPS
jgi:hypothetical protein